MNWWEDFKFWFVNTFLAFFGLTTLHKHEVFKEYFHKCKNDWDAQKTKLENDWRGILKDHQRVAEGNVHATNVTLKGQISVLEHSHAETSALLKDKSVALDLQLKKTKDAYELLDDCHKWVNRLKIIIHTLGHNCQLKQNNSVARLLGPDLHEEMQEVIADKNNNYDHGAWVIEQNKKAEVVAPTETAGE